MRPVYRPDPILPVQAMETYEVVSPVQTHTRPARCHDVDCPNYINGWATVVDVGTDLGRRQADWIRLHSARHYNSEQVGDTVRFVFAAGQTCFADHRVPLDRPALYVKRGGDWRARTSEPVQMRAVDWVDDFANHQELIADRQRQG